MPNPAMLLLDSDVLVQLFLAGDLRIFDGLKRKFGIQPAVVLEVDIELRWLARHKDRLVAQLEKTLKHGTLVKLDQPLFQSFLSNAAPGASWSTFQALGSQYNGYVQRGEAYTYAAAVTLGLPAASNDFRAIQTLQFQMLTLPTPVLRCFDLLVFAHECGILKLKDCEAFRSELLKLGEHIPRAFLHSSFEDAIATFGCRLTKSKGTAGSTTLSPTSFDEPLIVTEI
jgi:hypothetical protein